LANALEQTKFVVIAHGLILQLVVAATRYMFENVAAANESGRRERRVQAPAEDAAQKRVRQLDASCCSERF